MKKLLILLVFLFNANIILGQSITWTGAYSDSWNDRQNWSGVGWSGDSVPTPCHQINIPTVVRPPKLYSGVYISKLNFTGGDLITNGQNINYVGGTTTPFSYVDVGSLEDNKIFGKIYRSQNPDSSRSCRRVINTCAPIYKMEIQPGDYWSGDANNLSGGVPRERSELSERGVSTEFDKDTWISYSIYVEPGDSINYTVKDWYTFLGQWHQAEGEDDAKSGPAFGFSFSQMGKFVLETTGQGTLPDPLPVGVKAVRRDSTVLTRGEWHDFVIRVKFSPTAGQIQWWVDKEEQCNLSGIPIGYVDGQAGYWKFGIYRSHNVKSMAVRYANTEVARYPNSLMGRVAAPLLRE